MVIGGLASAVWGNPRATLDIDVTIWVVDEHIQRNISILEKKFACMVEDPISFVSETRVLPVKTIENLRIDIIFGKLPFEKKAIDRAVEVEVGDTSVMFCTAEDLILFKIISERPKDKEDVRNILRFQNKKLDFEYLEPRITELSDLLDRPDILQHWDQWKNEEVK